MKQKNKFRFVKKFGPYLIKLLIGSLSIKFINESNFKKIKNRHGTVIYAFWHNRMLPLTYTHKNKGIHIIISEHKDGEYIALTTQELGFNTIRGSSTRGGIKALKEAVNKIKYYDIAVTPDGPRGPKEKVSDGVLFLSYKTGKPIIPVSLDSNKKWVLNTWDDFIIPKPFAYTRIIYGKPVFVNNKEEINIKKKVLKNELTKITNEVKF